MTSSSNEHYNQPLKPLRLPSSSLSLGSRSELGSIAAMTSQPIATTIKSDSDRDPVGIWPRFDRSQSPIAIRSESKSGHDSAGIRPLLTMTSDDGGGFGQVVGRATLCILNYYAMVHEFYRIKNVGYQHRISYI